MCSECNGWSHMKCLNMSKAIAKYYLERSELDWTCLLCSLPKCGESFFAEKHEFDVINESWKIQTENEAIDQNEGAYANYLTTNTEANDRDGLLR